MSDNIAWRVDPDLDRQERETYVRFAADEDRAHVHTDNPHVLKRLRTLSHWEETRVYRTGNVIHGGEGTVPVGSLKVKASARKSRGQAAVIAEGSTDE